MKAPKLQAGDTIGIVSPARWLNEDTLKKGISMLEDRGYSVKTGSACRLRDDQYAGTSEDRAWELEEMFVDPQVKAIVCARGGYGAIRVSDILNYTRVSDNPKIFVGYSDITVLHASISKMTGLVTFHGPMLIDCEKTVDDYTWRCLFETLSHDEPGEVTLPDNQKAKILRKGLAEGELYGGNLVLLTNLIGTQWDFDTAGKILFVEEVGEKLYRIDRMLLHLRRAGKLDHIVGLIVGEMSDVGDNEVPFGMTVEQIVLDICRGTNFPIISNFPCGHGVHNATLPISVKARLDCSGDEPLLVSLESAVK